MKNLMKLGLLFPCIGFAVSCGSTKITPTKTDYVILGFTQNKYYAQAGIDFDLGNKLHFDEAQQSAYTLDCSATLKEASFDKSYVKSIKMGHWGWSTSQVAGESKKTVIGFGCYIQVYTSTALANKDTFKVDLDCKFLKDKAQKGEVKTTLNFTVELYD